MRYPRAVSTLVSTKTQRHDMNPEQSKKPSSRSRQIILDAIRELTALGHLITRGNLREATGLSMHIIDDHVSRMVDEDGALRRVRPGVYELVMGVGNMPAIYFTETDEGATIIEVEGCGKLVLDDHRVTRKIAERLEGSYAPGADAGYRHQFGMAAQDLMLELKATGGAVTAPARNRRAMCATAPAIGGKVAPSRPRVNSAVNTKHRIFWVL